MLPRLQDPEQYENSDEEKKTPPIRLRQNVLALQQRYNEESNEAKRTEDNYNITIYNANKFRFSWVLLLFPTAAGLGLTLRGDFPVLGPAILIPSLARLLYGLCHTRHYCNIDNQYYREIQTLENEVDEAKEHLQPIAEQHSYINGMVGLAEISLEAKERLPDDIMAIVAQYAKMEESKHSIFDLTPLNKAPPPAVSRGIVNQKILPFFKDDLRHIKALVEDYQNRQSEVRIDILPSDSDEELEVEKLEPLLTRRRVPTKPPSQQEYILR